MYAFQVQPSSDCYQIRYEGMQGCALRKISGSPSGSQAFYLSRPDLKVGRPKKKFRGAPRAPKHSSRGTQASQVGRPSTSDEEVF